MPAPTSRFKHAIAEAPAPEPPAPGRDAGAAAAARAPHHARDLELATLLLRAGGPLAGGVALDARCPEHPQEVVDRAGKMLEEGAAILDVGGMSSRPGAELIPESEELDRVLPGLEALRQAFPDALVSIDTIRAGVARKAIEAGACLVNDISAGRYDPDLFPLVAELKVPYVLMHMQGDPASMQKRPTYADVVLDVLDFFLEKVADLRRLGVVDILLDPGFGFGKSVTHNYQLLNGLHVFRMLDCPVLAGISRKSMICKVLKVAPAEALNGTTALHMVALQQGARLLRVHDVREARELIQLWRELEKTAVNY